MSRAAASSVGEVLALYVRWGEEPYDEALSQSSHAAQVAAWAEADGAPDHLVAAALLHDVGHLLAMEAEGHGRPDAEADRRHEAVGARWLAAILPPEVTAPIALHVQAKRYRCAVEPGAEEALSDGSRASLVRQGGPMAPDEATRFASLPGAGHALRLRTWDDAGKALDVDPAPVASHRALLERLARRPI